MRNGRKMLTYSQNVWGFSAAAALLAEVALGDDHFDDAERAAIERLVACENAADAIKSLVGALGDGENTGRRNAAVDALIHFGGGAVPALLPMNSLPGERFSPVG